MNPKTPELLLVFYIFLPVGSPLVAPVLLGQIKAIQAIRRTEKKLNASLNGLDLDNLDSDSTLDSDTDEGLDDESSEKETVDDEVLKELLLSFWFDPGNTATYGYLGLLSPHLYLGPSGHSIVDDLP